MMNHAVSMHGLFYEILFHVICVYVVTKDSNGKDYLLMMWTHHCRNGKTQEILEGAQGRRNPSTSMVHSGKAILWY